MRYIGGKFRIRKQLINFLLNPITESDCFAEVFCGSCNLTLDLLDNMDLFVPNKIILNDFHIDLMMMWESVYKGEIELPDSFTEEEYEALRNAESSALRGFIGHACSFGGIWFSKFAKTSDGRNYCLNGKNSIMKLINLFNTKVKNVEFYNLSYEQVPIPDGAVVYCDPPYIGTAKPGSGGEFDHEKFWQWVRGISSRCEVFTSEYVAPEDFECVLEIPVSLDMGKRENRVEKLFKYRGSK